tara:strand:+ start:461 stop:724 length:264 start_codon:yes stop_codon:yes gene_type:complete
MYYYVYMLISKGNKPVSYIGYTNNLKNRIKLHNSGKGAKFTRGRKWKLIYKEKFRSKNKAISREYYIKKNRALRNKLKNENLNITSI